MDIGEILAGLKRPERTADICLAADLTAEHEKLNRRLVQAQQDEALAGAKMSDLGKAADLARQIRDLEDRIKASSVTFRFQALSLHEQDAWFADHPPREGKQERFNAVTGPPALVAASCVDPKMSPEQAVQLSEKAGTKQFDRLFTAAWQATFEDDSSVPFSVAASVTLRASEPKQK